MQKFLNLVPAEEYISVQISVQISVHISVSEAPVPVTVAATGLGIVTNKYNKAFKGKLN
jgi:hypothetical protein